MSQAKGNAPCFSSISIAFVTPENLHVDRQVMKEFNVSETVASLGLALYVLGCEFADAIFLVAKTEPNSNQQCQMGSDHYSFLH